MNATKIYQKMKSKSLLNREKNITEWEKTIFMINFEAINLNYKLNKYRSIKMDKKKLWNLMALKLKQFGKN